MTSAAASSEELECDYLVIGAGACGIAFVDGLLERQSGTRVLMVDRQAQPGGHWVVDYSFVALHQPSSYYGVESVKLSGGCDDRLSTRAELLSYFEQVMSKFQATGRVRYFPLCDCSVEAAAAAAASGESLGGAPGMRVSFQSLVSSACTYNVTVRRKFVDTTYLNIVVPSMRPPPYSVESGATVVSCNAVATGTAGRRFTILGAGKTAMDTIVFLLRRGVPAGSLTWIVPGDAWLVNREYVRGHTSHKFFAMQGKIFTQNRSLRAVLLELEKEGFFFRVDPEVWPTKYRCAIVDEEELRLLRSVRDVVRQGRVASVGCSAIHFASGAVVATTSDTVHVDCTANGLRNMAPKLVWSPGFITLQPGFVCQPLACAVMIAAIECLTDKDLGLGVGETAEDGRNRMLQPVPHPETPADYLASAAVTSRNTDVWEKHPKLAKVWMGARVFFPSHWSRLAWLELIWSGIRHINPGVLKANLLHMYKEEFGKELYLAPAEPADVVHPGGGALALKVCGVAAMLAAVLATARHLRSRV